MDQKLSAHFTLREAIRSQDATRRGLDNTPPAEVAKNLIATAENILEPVRAKFGPFAPSSWYRSPGLNEAIGSKPGSQHVLGEAVDFEVSGVANVVLAHWCRENLKFDQLILEFHDPAVADSGWVHCSFVHWRAPRGDVLTIGKAGTVHGLPLLSAAQV